MSEGAPPSIQSITGKLGSLKKKIRKEMDAGKETRALEEEKRGLERKIADYNAAKETKTRSRKYRPTSHKGLLEKDELFRQDKDDLFGDDMDEYIGEKESDTGEPWFTPDNPPFPFVNQPPADLLFGSGSQPPRSERSYIKREPSPNSQVKSAKPAKQAKLNVELTATKTLAFDPKLMLTYRVPLILLVPEASKEEFKIPVVIKAKDRTFEIRSTLQYSALEAEFWDRLRQGVNQLAEAYPSEMAGALTVEEEMHLRLGSSVLLLMGFQSRRTKDRVSYTGDENSRARYFQDHDAITNLLESAAFRDKLLIRKRDMRAGEMGTRLRS